jgi:hypothetical protein
VCFSFSAQISLHLFSIFSFFFLVHSSFVVFVLPPCEASLLKTLFGPSPFVAHFHKHLEQDSRIHLTTMGNLVWHHYARLVTITASVYAVWASFWALIFRKFFWDFIGGTLRDPGGLQPSPASAVFITLIVKMPVIPIFAMVVAVTLLVIEFPLPFVKGTAIHRSFVVRLVLLFFSAFLNLLYYQGTNAGIYSIVAMICYTRAQLLGETMEEAKENRGRAGAA